MNRMEYDLKMKIRELRETREQPITQVQEFIQDYQEMDLGSGQTVENAQSLLKSLGYPPQHAQQAQEPR